jgi:hypothetical protein
MRSPFVIPAQAGIQLFILLIPPGTFLDARIRGHDAVFASPESAGFQTSVKP